MKILRQKTVGSIDKLIIIVDYNLVTKIRLKNRKLTCSSSTFIYLLHVKKYKTVQKTKNNSSSME